MEEKRWIREAAPLDAEELLRIYAPYVTDTAVTFEYEVPTPEAFAERMRCVQKRYPYLAAESAQGLLGYAYASPFKERAAYDWAVETSIYVRRELRGMGVGRLLYQALEQALSLQGILNLNACIACPAADDPYLTRDSILFHGHLGYRMVGEFDRCGYKFGRWYQMVWMEKHIGEHLQQQPPIKPFSEVRERWKQQLERAL